MKPLSQNIPFLIVALLAVDGLHFVFARALHDQMHPVSSVVWVLGVATLQVAGFGAWQRRLSLDAFRRHPIFFLALGAIVATSTSINYVAVEFIDPGTASLLAQSSILFGLGLGVWWLRERLTRTQLAGAALAILGVVVITFHPGDIFRVGALMVVVSSALYALHAALVKRYGSDIDFLEFFVWRLVVTTGFLILSAGVQSRLSVPAGAAAWAWVIAAGTIDVVVSRTLYYLSLRRLPVSIHSLILTLSPVVAILWSLALFGEWPTLRDLIGGAAVMAGVALVTYRRA